MKKTILYSLLLHTLFAGIGCSKFLEEQSQNLSYAKTWQKLDEVMRGEVYLRSNAVLFKGLNSMDDDIIDYAANFAFFDQRNEIFGTYLWQANPFTQFGFLEGPDVDWPNAYRRINAANMIIHQTGQLKDNPQELQRIKGEALFMRAFYYFYLVNIYAKPYSKATAKTEMGVPLKITEYVEDRFFSRSTVDSVYQQMVSDLLAAEQCLEDIEQHTTHRVDINSVYLLQSRVYLYMEEWDKSAAAAEKLLLRKPELSPLSAHEPRTSFLNLQSPEILFSQGNNLTMGYMPEPMPPSKAYKPTDELIDLYAEDDLRKSIFVELLSSGNYRYTKVYASNQYGIVPTERLSDVFTLRTAEGYLNQAESLALLGDEDGANAAINTLRKARFLPEAYEPIHLSGAALIDFIRDERRRELCFEGHRWFDLRRYSVHPTYPFTKTITHTYSDANFATGPFVKATLVLEPHDPAYVFPIPSQAIIFNQGVLEQNPDRPDRTF